jgi:hypothetical protein
MTIIFQASIDQFATNPKREARNNAGRVLAPTSGNALIRSSARIGVSGT